MIESTQATFTVKVRSPGGQELIASGLTKEMAEWLDWKLTSPSLPKHSTITDNETRDAWFKCPRTASFMFRDAVRWTEDHYGIKHGN